MSRSAYGKPKCYVCGRRYSGNGLAQYNHKMFHVRRGEMDRKLIFRDMLGTRWRFDITPAGIQARRDRKLMRRLMT